MEEYVAKSVLKKELNIANLHSGIVSALQNIVDDLPTADVVEVKHGHLIYHDDPFLGLTSECSNCHIHGMLSGNYCPNCGAKMDSEESN